MFERQEAGSAATPKTLIMSAYQALRRDIIEGKLAPGQKLRVEHLKDNYGVGAATLREAMGLLAADALVTVQGQRGFRVANISLEDFRDITQTRIVLETRALQLSIENGDKYWEASLTASFHLLTRAEEHLTGCHDSFNEWEKANQQFHSILISQSMSPWTQHFLAILYSQAERYRRILLVNRPLSRDVHREHREIFEAAIARKADTAIAVLAKHVGYNLELLQEMEPEVLDAYRHSRPAA